MFTLSPMIYYGNWLNNCLAPWWPYKPDNYNRSRHGRYKQNKVAAMKRIAARRAKRKVK
jgi:hypothetical protein